MTRTAEGGSRLGALKGLAIALALVFTIAIPRPSHAMEFFIDYASMDLSRTGVIKKNGSTYQTVYMAPVLFKTFYGTGNTPATGAITGPVDWVAWCVDIFHPFILGDVNLQYNDNHQLETNSKYQGNAAHAFEGATPLTDGQLTQVGALVHYGTKVYNLAANSADKLNKLSAIQGAIWQVINAPGGFTVVSGNSNAGIRNAVNGYIAKFVSSNYMNYILDYGPVGQNVRFLTQTGKYGTGSARQSFAVVPEPITWAMMIIGFFAMGATLRRRNRQVAAA